MLGAKISQSKEGTRIIEADGTAVSVDSRSAVQHLAPESQQLCQTVQEVSFWEHIVILNTTEYHIEIRIT